MTDHNQATGSNEARPSDETLVDHITGRPIDLATGTPTTGHEWDGIRELDTPMPRWWLWTLYATIAWSLVYFVLYPAIPLVNEATAGLLGYSSREEVEDEITRVDVSRADIDAVIAAAPLDQIAATPQLASFAQRGGASAFKLVCVQCHGSGSQGSPGYPNLNDDDWLWGGTLDEIHATIRHGIRNDDDPQAHFSVMPAFGADGILDRTEIDQVAEHVLAISGQEHDAARAADGAAIFQQQCASCHGAEGRGDDTQGAPNLTDPIWLYGGDKASLVAQLRQPKHGAMPPWADYFDEATVKKLAVYVHSLGGGVRDPGTPAIEAPAAIAVPAEPGANQ